MTRTTHHSFEITNADITNGLVAARRERSLAFHAIFEGLFDRKAKRAALTEGCSQQQLRLNFSPSKLR